MAQTTAIVRGSQRCGRTVRIIMGMRRRADLTRIVRVTMTCVARIVTGMTSAIRHGMSRTISPGAVTISAKATRLRRRSVAMSIASVTGATAPAAPPEGHHWSYIDGNYVLIAAATGIITSILVSGALGH